jgi:hypothetical protein
MAMLGEEVVPFDADEFAAAMQWLLTDKERYDRRGKR